MGLANRLRTAVRRLGIDVQRAIPEWAGLQSVGEPATVIDVGVAWGTPVLYGRFPKAELLLIEPVPMFHAQIEATILADRRGRLVRAAAGSTKGSLELAVPDSNPLKASALQRSEMTAERGPTTRVSVEVDCLDVLVERAGATGPFLLKIDTEGFELEVLKGAQATLAECVGVITETNILPRFEGSYHFEELVDYMRDAGFRVGQVLAAPHDRDGLVRYLDLLFVPRSARS